MTTQLSEPEFMDSSLDQVKADSLPFDHKRAVHTWKKYGYSEVPALVRDFNGKIYDDRKNKGIFRNKFYVDLVSRNYVLLPNEECDDIVHSYIKHYGAEFGLYLFKTYTAYRGKAQYWEVRSKKAYTIPNSYRNNDRVQLGFVLSNSVGGNVPFGLNVFTFCLVCENGAIAKGSDLLSMKIKHYGKNSLKMMTENLDRRVHDIINEGAEVIKQYEKAAKLRLRLEGARQIARRISQKYLPDYFEITKNKNLTLKRNVTFWEAFNDVTESVWHNDDLSFLTKGDMTNHLHRVMNKEILVAEQRAK